MNISFYVDAHVHCFEIDISELKKYFDEGFRIVCVSDDTSSSYETIRLADENPFIKPCIGVHPWLIDSTNTSLFFEMLNEKIDLVKCIGEVGLDKKFKPDTFHKQIVFFEEILKFAKEYDLVLNIHAAGAWREVYESLIRMDINRAYIHWYTGPMNLMYEITGAGYYIGLNPAWIIQEKH
ncbi:MAG: TatD family hydrolase, partial [Desulfurococcaceae archaeon]